MPASQAKSTIQTSNALHIRHIFQKPAIQINNHLLLRKKARRLEDAKDLARCEREDEVAKDARDEPKDGRDVEDGEHEGKDATNEVLDDEDEAGEDGAEVAENDDEQDLDVEGLDDVDERADNLEHDGDEGLDKARHLNVGELEHALDGTEGDGDSLDEVNNDVQVHLDDGHLGVGGLVAGGHFVDGLVDDAGVDLDRDEKTLARLDDIGGSGDHVPLDVDGSDDLDLIEDILDVDNADLVVVEEGGGQGRDEKGAEGEDAGETHFLWWILSEDYI